MLTIFMLTHKQFTSHPFLSSAFNQFVFPSRLSFPALNSTGYFLRGTGVGKREVAIFGFINKIE